MKKCFVISPIGEEGSAVREHADDVYDYIIRPAMDECSVECLRSDHLHEPGKISEQMFREIFNSDVCVAVLTGHNPNVFYELALAQASGRPVIVLIEKSEELPFDIRDLRCVAYDLKPRSLFDRVYARQVASHINNLERLNWKVDSPFGESLQLAAFQQVDDKPTYFPRYSALGGTDDWLKIIQGATERCDLMSLTLDSWKNRNGFREALVQKAASGCRVRLLQMHSENPMLADFAAEPKSFKYVAPLASLTAEFFGSLEKESRNIEFRQIRQGCPHFRIILVDDQAFMSPYLFCNGNSPLFRTTEECPLYETIEAEFDGLWNLNQEPGDGAA